MKVCNEFFSVLKLKVFLHSAYWQEDVFQIHYVNLTCLYNLISLFFIFIFQRHEQETSRRKFFL